jgi:hypothetical protein
VTDPFIGIIREQDSLARRIGQTEVRESRGVIIARYTTAAGQSFNSGSTDIINFGTLVRDPLSRVTTGVAWKFTANVAGDYVVAASILFAGTTGWADTEAGLLSLHYNNSATAYSFLDRKDSYGSASSVLMRLSGTDTIYLNAGDQIDIRAGQTSGAVLALFASASFNYINIWRL